MARQGINTDYGRPNLTPLRVLGTGARIVRLVPRKEIDATDYLKALIAGSAKPWLIITKESLEPWNGDWESAAEYYANKYAGLAYAVSGGNEPDISSPSSFTQLAQDYDRLNEIVFRRFRSYNPTIIRVGGGLASGGPEWLGHFPEHPYFVNLALYDAVSVHPYGQRFNNMWPLNPNATSLWGFGTVPNLLTQYRSYLDSRGYPEVRIWVGEWGIDARGWRDDANSYQDTYTEQGLAFFESNQLAEVACYFCLSDTMVWPFGLYDEQDRLKPAGITYILHMLGNAPMDTYDIGTGIRESMMLLKDAPRSDEEYHHISKSGKVSYSQCMGRDFYYRWTPEDGTRVLANGFWLPVAEAQKVYGRT